MEGRVIPPRILLARITSQLIVSHNSTRTRFPRKCVAAVRCTMADEGSRKTRALECVPRSCALTRARSNHIKHLGGLHLSMEQCVEFRTAAKKDMTIDLWMGSSMVAEELAEFVAYSSAGRSNQMSTWQGTIAGVRYVHKQEKQGVLPNL